MLQLIVSFSNEWTSLHFQEVIMMLESCTKDFKSLIERLNLLKAYEAADENNKYV